MKVVSISPIDVDLAVFPKISLHDHLDGGLRPATILELAEHQLPADTAEELAEWFFSAANSGSLETYLQTFDHTTAVMQTAENLTRIAREFVEDLVEDGVIYAEVRWAPEQHLKQGLSLDEAVQAVQAGFEEGMAAADDEGYSIDVNQILCAMRHADNAQQIAELAVRHRENGVVGFDIAGAEAGFPAERFADTFTWLAQHNFPITVHAGEAAGAESISDALVSGRALRIGHGVHLADDILLQEDEEGALATLGELAETVQLRNIVLELCPTSNLQTGAVKTDDQVALKHHPFGLLYDLGFAVTVNPDNRLISGVSITDELYLLAETYGYDLEDLLQFQLNAANAAFTNAFHRKELIEDITDGWRSLLDEIASDGPNSPALLAEIDDE